MQQEFQKAKKRKRDDGPAAQLDKTRMAPSHKQPDSASSEKSAKPSPEALAKCKDSWTSYSECFAKLQAETRTIDAIIYKNQNQHRRAPYWQAMRRAHKNAGRVLSGLRAISEPHFVSATEEVAASAQSSSSNSSSNSTSVSSSSSAALSNGSAIARLRTASAICSEIAGKTLLDSRIVTTQQTGAGFAPLMAVLVGSIAQYLYLTLRLRDALDAVAGPAADARGKER